MKEEIPKFPHEKAELQIYGAGLCRDTIWIQAAIVAGFDVTIRDISKVACNKAQGLIAAKRMLAKENEPVRTPGGASWGRVRNEQILSTEVIDASKTIAIYASQFVEHQDDMPGFMRSFGKFIQHPGRRVYLVLPFLEDNPRGEVKWDSAKPLYAYEWQTPLVEGFGGKPDIRILGKHKYFNRMYTCVRLMGT